MRRFVVTVGVLALAGAASGAQSPGQRCQTLKNQEAGRYAACLHKAEAKLLRTKGACSATSAKVCYGDVDCPVAATCDKDLTKYGVAVGKCASKFAARWSKLTQAAADKGDPCPDGLVESDIKEVIDGCAARVAADLAGDGLNCGNGAIDGGEDCDLGDLNGATCASEGFFGGTLACGAGCAYDTSDCWADRFVTNASGTVTDNQTGLEWEPKVKLNSTTDLQDADKTYRWSGTCSVGGAYCQPDAASEAACLAGVDGDTYGCAQCASGACNVSSPGITVWQWLNDLNTASFGGHNDWRVPTKNQLEGIVDATKENPAVDVAFHGTSCGAGCTDVTDPACACTRSDLYWSASSGLPFRELAWAVEFYEGSEYAGEKTRDAISVRAVRGGS